MKVRASWLIGLALLGTGFVRQTTPTGTPIEWQRSCPLLRVGHVAEPGPSAEQVRDAVQEAIDAWQSDGCNNLPLTVNVASPAFDSVGYDGFNVVLTRSADHCDAPEHADDEICLSPNALAVTTTFYIDEPGEPDDGELLETDLEINLRHQFSVDGAPGAYDLVSVVTHELGHILGLEHSCTTERGARVVDPAGNLVPSCSSTSAIERSLADATMYPWVDPGDTIRRTPEADERQAICLVYRKHPGTCEMRVELTACACSNRSDEPSTVLVGLGAILLITGRRRRR